MKNFFLVLVLCFQNILGHCSNTYVSKENLMKIADHVYDFSFNAEDVKENDIVYVFCRHYESFFNKTYPQIKEKFILMTHGGDLGMPRKYAYVLEDEKLIFWFAHNVENYSHEKLKAIPLGLGYSFYNVDRTIIDKVKQQSIKKSHLLYMNFNKLTHRSRLKVYDLFHDKSYCYNPKRQKFEKYLQDLAGSIFVLSPRGTGLDCFRTWEALYMDAIPIVETSTLDPLYENLPILIIKDWNEITEEFLLEKYKEMSNKKYSFEALDINYWHNLIHSYKLK